MFENLYETLNGFSVFVAFFIITFIICISLVIFAPRSQNFFKEVFPDLEKLSERKDIIDETFVNLDIKLNDDNLAAEYEELYKNKKQNAHEIKWEEFPDKNIISGEVEILPIFMFSKINEINKNIFDKLFNFAKPMTSIQSIHFIKLKPKAKIKKHTGWADISNNTLRYIYCFNSFCYSDEECGIWVNGESKKLFKDYSYIYDSSKEHSIYNNTFDEIIFLIIDFDRPKNINVGFSEYNLSKPDNLRKPSDAE